MSKAPNAAVEKDILKSAMERVAEEQGNTQGAEPAPVANAPARKKPGPKPKSAAATKAPIKPAMITYIPLDEGDMPFTTWHGLKFKANVPREVSNPELITSAKTNPWFSVEGNPPAKRAPKLAPRDTSEDVQSKPEKELGGVEIEAEELVGDEEAA